MTDQPLAVLTYNVSYEAMTHRDTGSAGRLGAKCYPVSEGSRVTLCARNMAQAIDRMPESLGASGFDFVALQESSRVEVLHDLSGELGRMEMLRSRSGYAEMASFYDPERYVCDRFIPGAFSWGRPFHLLYCRRLDGAGGVVFINLHSPHHASFRLLESRLGEVHEGLDLKPMDEALREEERSYRIIAAGDFNETGWSWSRGRLTETSWRPLKHAGVDTEVSIERYPHSCCKADGDWEARGGGLGRGARGGDYIFDSRGAAEAVVPETYDPDELQSDHLPVVARL